MPRMSYEGLVGTLLALIVVILDQAGIKNQYVLWGAFILAVSLCLDATIRSGASANGKLAITVVVIVGFAVFGWYLWTQPSRRHDEKPKVENATAAPAKDDSPSPIPKQVVKPGGAAKKKQAQIPSLQQPTAPATVTQQAAQPQSVAPPIKTQTLDDFMAEMARKRKEMTRKAIAEEPPCRGDDLKLCGDYGLLEWGKPLVEKLKKVADALSLDRKIAMEKYSGPKYIDAIEAVYASAADDFRECCATDAVRYHKELASRLGGGKQDEKFYQWVEMLQHPPRSKEWKAARSDSGRLTTLPYEIEGLQLELQTKLDLKIIDSMRQ
jgi:hypothetical protein